MITNEAKAYQDSREELTHKSANNSSISIMLEVYKSVSDANGIFYCSAPITSGKRYINWLERIGQQFIDIDKVSESYRESHFKEVIEPNRKHANQIIQRLRQQTGKVVVDPTALPYIPDWTQQDWRFFWQQVIERYVTMTFFIDDWQYSNGCAYEFLVSQKKGISVFDENQKILSLAKGVNLIREAIFRLQQRGATTTFIEEVLKDIQTL